MNIKNIVYLSALFVNVAFARDINLLLPQKYDDVKAFAILSDYKAHMWNIRQKNKNPIFKFVNNPKYSDTVYHVIPSEILTACLGEGIYKNSGLITLEHIGQDIKNYTVSNMNYLMLVNIINLYKHKQVNDDAIEEVKKLIIGHFKDKIDQYRLNKSVSDIRFYFNNMKLADYLPAVLNVQSKIFNDFNDNKKDTVFEYKYTELSETELLKKNNSGIESKYYFHLLIKYTDKDRFSIMGDTMSQYDDACNNILDKINCISGNKINQLRGIINLKDITKSFKIDTSYYSSAMMFLYNSDKFRNVIYKLAEKHYGLGRIIRDIFNLMNSNVTLFSDSNERNNHHVLYIKMLKILRNKLKSIKCMTYDTIKKQFVPVIRPDKLISDIYSLIQIECKKSGNKDLQSEIDFLFTNVMLSYLDENDNRRKKILSEPIVYGGPYKKLHGAWICMENENLAISELLCYNRCKIRSEKKSIFVDSMTPNLENEEALYAPTKQFTDFCNTISYNSDARYKATGVIRNKGKFQFTYIDIINKKEAICDKINSIYYDIKEDKSDVLIRFQKREQ